MGGRTNLSSSKGRNAFRTEEAGEEEASSRGGGKEGKAHEVLSSQSKEGVEEACGGGGGRGDEVRMARPLQTTLGAFP